MDISSPPEGVTVDPGLACLTLLLRFYGIAVERRAAVPSARHPHHRQDRDAARGPAVQPEGQGPQVTTLDRLANTPLPAIAQLKDGGFVVVAKADDKKILLQAPNEPRPGR